MNLNIYFLYSSNNNFQAASYLSMFLRPLKCISKIDPCNQEAPQYGQGGLAVTVSLGVLPSVLACVQGQKVAICLMQGAVPRAVTRKNGDL